MEGGHALWGNVRSDGTPWGFRGESCAANCLGHALRAGAFVSRNDVLRQVGQRGLRRSLSLEETPGTPDAAGVSRGIPGGTRFAPRQPNAADRVMRSGRRHRPGQGVRQTIHGRSRLMRFSERVGSWFSDFGSKEFRQWVLRSTLITLFTWFGGPTPAAAQNTGNLPPGPPIVYVSNAGGGITEVNTAGNYPLTSSKASGRLSDRGKAHEAQTEHPQGTAIYP